MVTPPIKKVMKEGIISIVISFFGWIPILNILIILPLAFYFGLRTYKLARKLDHPTKWKRILSIVFGLFCMINAVLVWIIAATMFILISFKII